MEFSQPFTTVPHIEISPATALADEPISVRLFGFPPNCPVSVRAWTLDDARKRWESYGTFQADEAGNIDLTLQPSLTGTYDGVDPMGLLWSMRLVTQVEGATIFSKPTVAPMQLTISGEVDGESKCVATAERLGMMPGVTRIPVKENGLAGTFFQPLKGAPLGNVIVLAGSSGGALEWQAALLASHGFATLALAYFAYEHLPAALRNVPLEYFETAIHWLQNQENVKPNSLGVTGISKGGELALLLGATFSQVNAVVAYAPSGLIWEGFGGSDNASDLSAWTFRGKQLPHVPSSAADAFESEILGTTPRATMPLYLRRIQSRDVTLLEDATIPVEKINGPILLISGKDDQIWPSSLMSELVIERLQRMQFRHPYEHVSYPGAGHLIRPPYLPATVTYFRHPIDGHAYAFGGNASAVAFAQSDSWIRTLEFFSKHL